MPDRPSVPRVKRKRVPKSGAPPKAGYVINPRKSFHDDPLYQSKPYDPWHAWQDLCHRANFAVDAPTEELARGQLHVSYGELRDDWGWKKRAVRYHLELWASPKQDEEDKLRGRIVLESTTTGMLVTIVNYERYQSPERYSVSGSRSRHTLRHTSRHTCTTPNDAQGGDLEDSDSDLRHTLRHTSRHTCSGNSLQDDDLDTPKEVLRSSKNTTTTAVAAVDASQSPWGAMSESEKKAVRDVLGLFFKLTRSTRPQAQGEDVRTVLEHVRALSGDNAVLMATVRERVSAYAGRHGGRFPGSFSYMLKPLAGAVEKHLVNLPLAGAAGALVEAMSGGMDFPAPAAHRSYRPDGDEVEPTEDVVQDALAKIRAAVN